MRVGETVLVKKQGKRSSGGGWRSREVDTYLKPSDIEDIRRKLPPDHRDWKVWNEEMLLSVVRESNPKERAVAHWYELAYLRYRVETIVPNAAQGGIRSNKTELEAFSALLVKWNMLPIEKGAVGVELEQVDKDRFKMLFEAHKSPDQREGLKINVHRKEVKLLPFRFQRSDEFDNYRPLKAYAPYPPLNDWVWDINLMNIADKLAQTADDAMREFNEYMRRKIEAEILTKFVKPTEYSRRQRRLGKYIKRRGIKSTDKKPVITASLGTFGQLFWETKYGYHREFVEQRGKREGRAGTLNLIWTKSERFISDYAELLHEYFPWNHELYYREFVTVANLVEANHDKGNTLNFDIIPGNHALENCLDWPMPNKLDYPIGYTGEVVPASKDKGIIVPADYYQGHVAVQNGSINAIPTASDKNGIVSSEDSWYHYNTPQCVDHPDQEVEYKGGDKAYCETGDHYPDRVQPRGKGGGRYGSGACLSSFPLSRRRATEVDDLLRMFMKLHPTTILTAPIEFPVYSKLTSDERRQLRDIRGTTILLTNCEWIQNYMSSRFSLHEMEKWSDIYLIDVGIQDWSTFFKLEPDLLKNPKWQCQKCSFTKDYSDEDWKGRPDAYPPRCSKCGTDIPMKPIGRPLINYVYVGNDIDNMPYHVMRAVGAKMGGAEWVD